MTFYPDSPGFLNGAWDAGEHFPENNYVITVLGGHLKKTYLLFWCWTGTIVDESWNKNLSRKKSKIFQNCVSWNSIFMNRPFNQIFTFHTFAGRAWHRSVWTNTTDSTNRQAIRHNTCLSSTTRISDNTWVLTTLINTCMFGWTISIHTTFRLNGLLGYGNNDIDK